MATKPKRPCKKTGCPLLVTDGRFCPTHLSQERATYDRERRPSDRHALYHTARWARVRKQVLTRDPVCVACNKALANHADHVVPLEVAPDRAWDMDNIQGLCHSCHSSKTARENREKGKW